MTDGEQYEECVNCKVETYVPKALDIGWRHHYIEGVGQLCYECWHILYPPKESIHDELG